MTVRGYEYRVRYRRAGWTHAQSKKFQTAWRARTFLDKIHNNEALGLAPVVEVSAFRRTVGDWEEVGVRAR